MDACFCGKPSARRAGSRASSSRLERLVWGFDMTKGAPPIRLRHGPVFAHKFLAHRKLSHIFAAHRPLKLRDTTTRFAQ
ncbi:protein of unknown function [Pararobbsia alpina]